MTKPQLRTSGLLAISVFAGIVFLYSAWAKYDALELTEYTLVDYLKMPWMVAAIGSRLLTGLEAGIGMMLLLNLDSSRRTVARVALGLLAAFTVYLAYLWIFYGNQINCGCFGNAFFMNPATAIAKNLVLAVFSLLLASNPPLYTLRRQVLISALVLTSMVVLPFLLAPVTSKPVALSPGPHPIDLSPLYDSSNSVIPHTDLYHGKHILALLSPNCQHCQMAAYKMHLLRKQHPQLPFFLIVGGTKSDLSTFWKESGAQDIPWSRLESRRFMAFTGGKFPLLLWIDEGRTVAECNFNDLSEVSLLKWLNEPGSQPQQN